MSFKLFDPANYEDIAPGIKGFFAGETPVQGEGLVDGIEWYFRARGTTWSVEVYDTEDSNTFFCL